jgi:hypothetical protein
MGTVLIIVGLSFMVVGLIVFLIPIKEQPAAQGVVGEVAELIRQFTALLDRVDKRYRPGLVLMGFGLALVALGIFLETQNAKDVAAKSATMIIVR